MATPKGNPIITLKVGDKAPAFSALNESGKKVSLKDFAGRKVVLYFYPEDDTPTCNQQACNLRDNYQHLQQLGYEVVGVSPQGVKSHEAFRNKFQLPFTLLADEDMKIINAYGVWGPKKLYGREYDGLHRVTFVIDERGYIEKIVGRVLTKIATQQILKPN